MEIKLDNRVVAGIAVVVTAIVAYQEYSEPGGLLYHLNNNPVQAQSWDPNAPPPNPSPYGPAQPQPNPYGPNPNNIYYNTPQGPNPGYGPTPNGPAGTYGPSGYPQEPYQTPGTGQYVPHGHQQPGYGPANGPGQTDYTSETYEVDLGQPSEPDGW